jgi:4'-phosphopantetheinyl transferase
MNEQIKTTVQLKTPGPDTVHLWLLGLTGTGAENSAAFRAPPSTEQLHILDGGEVQRAARFANREAQQRYRLTRILLRNVLSSYCPDINPAAWRFDRNAHGKPFIASPALSLPLYFNLSHCESAVVVATSGRPGLGVDLEKITPRGNALAVARRYFSAREYALLNNLTAAGLPTGFFSLWTLKEAFSKACGGALVPALKKLSLDLPGERDIVVTPGCDEGIDVSAWRFWLFGDAEYRLALALQGVTGRQPVSLEVMELDNPARPDTRRPGNIPLLRQSR